MKKKSLFFKIMLVIIIGFVLLVLILVLIDIIGIVSTLLSTQSSSDVYAVSGSVDAERLNQLAIQNKDISVCNKIHMPSFGDVTDDELISVCYRKYAATFPTQNVCLQRPDDTLCFYAQARASGDTTYCSMDAYCFAIVAHIKGDINICDRMKVMGSDAPQMCRQYYRYNP